MRTRQVVSGTTTDYVQDLGAPLPVVLVEKESGQSAYYLYGLDLVGQEQTAWQYYHYDGLGSVRHLTGGSGRIVAEYSYYAFGQLRAASEDQGSAPKEKMLFTGEQRDPATELYFLRARYYDPGVGRFVSEDPFPGYVQRSQTLNLYVYVTNDPVNLMDPGGLQGTPPHDHDPIRDFLREVGVVYAVQHVPPWWEAMMSDAQWRQAFLDSATRHNDPNCTGLNTEQFAALLASIVALEGRDVGGDPLGRLGGNPQQNIKAVIGIASAVGAFTENSPIVGDCQPASLRTVKSFELLLNVGGGNQSAGLANVPPVIYRWQEDEAIQADIEELGITPPYMYKPGEGPPDPWPYDLVSPTISPFDQMLIWLPPDQREFLENLLHQMYRQDQNIEYLAFELEWQHKKKGCENCYDILGLYSLHGPSVKRIGPLITAFYERALGFLGR